MVNQDRQPGDGKAPPPGGKGESDEACWPGPRQWLESLYQRSPEPHLICSTIFDDHGQAVDFRVEYANGATVDLFGSPLEPGRRLLEAIPLAVESGLFAKLCRTVTGEKQEYHEELLWPAPQGEPRCYDVWMGKLGDGVILNFRDVTARRAVREALRQSETKLRNLFDHIPDLILLIDRQSRIRMANDRTPNVESGKLVGSFGFNHLAPETRQLAQVMIAKAMQTGEVQQMEAQTIYNEWWDCRLVPLSADEVMLICSKITDRKLAESRLVGEQQLLRNLFILQEQERKLISHEIHDGFLQQVVGAHMVLEAARGRWDREGTLVPHEIDSATSFLDEAISEGRRLISRLRPMIIDERGLIGAIEYLVAQEDFSRGLRINFRKAGRFDHLDPILESSVFRIVQEALTNVRRHSQSSYAQIDLRESDGRLSVEIRDDGIGFDPSRVPDDRFGVRGIVERARLFGGQGTITSQPGKGTCVRVEMPLHTLPTLDRSRP
jgi:signal transduction histidine kinase